jgi:hypothetical protein
MSANAGYAGFMLRLVYKLDTFADENRAAQAASSPARPALCLSTDSSCVFI